MARWKEKQYRKVILQRTLRCQPEANTEIRMKMQCGSLLRRADLLLLLFSYIAKGTEKMRSHKTGGTKLQFLLYQNDSQRLFKQEWKMMYLFIEHCFRFPSRKRQAAHS